MQKRKLLLSGFLLMTVLFSSLLYGCGNRGADTTTTSPSANNIPTQNQAKPGTVGAEKAAQIINERKAEANDK